MIHSGSYLLCCHGLNLRRIYVFTFYIIYWYIYFLIFIASMIESRYCVRVTVLARNEWFWVIKIRSNLYLINIYKIWYTNIQIHRKLLMTKNFGKKDINIIKFLMFKTGHKKWKITADMNRLHYCIVEKWYVRDWLSVSFQIIF